MTGRAIAFDRIATLVCGLGLFAFGGLLVAWQRGVVGAGAAVQVMFVPYLEMAWWPWALGGTGIVLVLLGGRWLATHRWAPKASRVALVAGEPGLTADATSVADAAASSVKEQAGVVKAHGSATLDRGTPTVTLTVTVPARRGLRSGVEAADRAVQTAGAMLGGGVALRSVLRVDAKRGPAVR